MGSRDYRHRETKKPKKSGKKLVSESLAPQSPPPEVEVIKKGKSRKGEIEPEE